MESQHEPVGASAHEPKDIEKELKAESTSGTHEMKTAPSTSHPHHEQRESHEQREQRESHEQREQRESHEQREQRESNEQREQRGSNEQREQRESNEQREQREQRRERRREMRRERRRERRHAHRQHREHHEYRKQWERQELQHERSRHHERDDEDFNTVLKDARNAPMYTTVQGGMTQQESSPGSLQSSRFRFDQRVARRAAERRRQWQKFNHSVLSALMIAILTLLTILLVRLHTSDFDLDTSNALVIAATVLASCGGIFSLILTISSFHVTTQIYDFKEGICKAFQTIYRHVPYIMSRMQDSDLPSLLLEIYTANHSTQQVSESFRNQSPEFVSVDPPLTAEALDMTMSPVPEEEEDENTEITVSSQPPSATPMPRLASRPESTSVPLAPTPSSPVPMHDVGEVRVSVETEERRREGGVVEGGSPEGRKGRPVVMQMSRSVLGHRPSDEERVPAQPRLVYHQTHPSFGSHETRPYTSPSALTLRQPMTPQRPRQTPSFILQSPMQTLAQVRAGSRLRQIVYQATSRGLGRSGSRAQSAPFSSVSY